MSLPGQIHPLTGVEDYACHNHDCFEQATYSICTYADAMGEVMEYYCDEHIEELRESTPPTTGQCEWCHTDGVLLQPYQDPTDGLNGPTYWICGSCRSEDIAAENDIDDYDDWIDEDVWDDEA